MSENAFSLFPYLKGNFAGFSLSIFGIYHSILSSLVGFPPKIQTITLGGVSLVGCCLFSLAALRILFWSLTFDSFNAMCLGGGRSVLRCVGILLASCI